MKIVSIERNDNKYVVRIELPKISWRHPLKRSLTRQLKISIACITFFVLSVLIAFSQDGNAGINEANTKVRSYFAAGTNLMYAVGAILGLIGAVKVYQKWNAGDHDTGKTAAAWFGSCVFLVVVTTVIRSFFGI